MLPQRLPHVPVAAPPLPILSQLANRLAVNHSVPILIASDAGTSFENDCPSRIFDLHPILPTKVTAAVVILDNKFAIGTIPPVHGVIIEGIEKLQTANNFLGEMIGCLAIEQIRAAIAKRSGPAIEAHSDCEAVVNLLLKALSPAPERSTSQKNQSFGQLLRVTSQARHPSQPPIQWVPSHVDRAKPATKTKPRREPIPPSERTLAMWANQIADRLADAHGNPVKLEKLSRKNWLPVNTIVISVQELLTQAMTPHMAYWCSNGLPTTAPTGDTSLLRTRDYLTSRASTSDYPPSYWSQSKIGLLEDTLQLVSPVRQADQRARALNTAWDQLPHGRKKAKFGRLPDPDLCPLCLLPDSLEHILLECPHLRETQQAELGRISELLVPPILPPGTKAEKGSLPKRAAEFLRRFMAVLVDPPPELSTAQVMALWLARPQQSTVEWLDIQLRHTTMAMSSLQRLRIRLTKILAKLNLLASYLWRERCRLAHLPCTPSAFSPMITAHDSQMVQLDLRSAFSPSGSLPSPSPLHLSPPEPTPASPSFPSPESPTLSNPSRLLPSRLARPSSGNRDNYQLFSDFTSAGLILPPDRAKELPKVPLQRKAGDYQLSWAAESLTCIGGGTGFYFELLTDRKPGLMLGWYYGEDTVASNLSYKDTLAQWDGQSDYVLADAIGQYAVKGDLKCGPAKANEGFSSYNCLLVFNKDRQRMELITAFALRRGTYEALVNYGIPGLPSQYWSPGRRNLLPEQAKTECEAYYPVPKATPMAPRTFQKKKQKQKKPNSPLQSAPVGHSDPTLVPGRKKSIKSSPIIPTPDPPPNQQLTHWWKRTSPDSLTTENQT